jgi:hypothetical protein
MQATHSQIRPGFSRQTGLIAVAILAAAALAAAAVFLESPARAGSTSAAPRGSVGAAVPVGSVGESAAAGDRSVPQASRVFRDSNAVAEESPVTF